MRKISISVIALALTITFMWANAVSREFKDRPLYSADLIKVKLSPDAVSRSKLPLGLYAEANRFNINELDQLMSVNGGQKIIRAHRRLKDTAWEEKTGFDRWYLIKLNGRVSVEDALSSFKANRYIEDACPEYYAYTTAVPNDTYYSNNWGHNNTAQLPAYSGGSHSGAGVGTIGFDSDAQLAWDQSQGYGSASIVIAVIDTGADTSHPDLRLVAGYDFGDNDSNPMDNSADPGHGTSCSGVAAGKANNGLGVTGIAGGCSVMPLKIANSSGSLLFTAIENALTYAGDHNVDVASMSFGAEGGMGEGSSPSTDAALEYAYSHGVALFAATANSNTSTIAYPSNHNKVISVGAASPTGQRKSTTSSDGEYWWGSNYGNAIMDDKGSVDIMGPTILPATDLMGTAGYNTSASPTGDYYMWFNGTSCATPYVAGCAALILSKDPTLTPSQLRTVITSTATDMTYDGGTGWDRYTGYGLINVNSALSLLADYPQPRNLVATAGNAVVNLSWLAPVFGSPTGYKIYRDNVLLTTMTGLSYVDYAVTNGTTYGYYVIAVYSGGESDPTATVYATPVAVNSVILGNGTSATGSSEGCPININRKSLHGQSVYTATELHAAGIFGPLDITQIGFYVNSVPSLALPSFIVRMKHTTAANVATWINSTNMITVYSATTYSPTAGRYDMLTLNTPFTWNGTDNIVIDTAFNIVATNSATGTVRFTSTTSGYRYTRSNTANQASVFSGGTLSASRPNVKLIFQYKPNIGIDPISLAFEAVAIGNTSVRQFTIQNTGDQTLTGNITTPTAYSVAQSARQTANPMSTTSSNGNERNTLAFSIPGGTSLTYDLTFSPSQEITYNGNVVITSNDPVDPTVNLSVTGNGYFLPTHLYARVKAFLQGPYISGAAMSHDITSLLPLTSPYNASHGVAALPDVSPRYIVDWIYLELRATVNGATTQARSAFLLDDGSVADLDGSNFVAFDYAENSDYYVILRHRNHLGIMSSTTHTLSTTSGSAPLIDLSIPDSVYGGNQAGVKLIEPGVLALYSGDADANGAVLPSDLNLYWRVQTGLTGYREADFDLDGAVLPSDLNLQWRLNTGLQSQIPVVSGK